MKWLFIITILSFGRCSTGIGNNYKENIPVIRSVQLVIKLPAVRDNGDIWHLTDSSIVYYDDKNFVYKISSVTYSELFLTNADPERRTDVLHSYYGFSQNSKAGYIFDNDWETVGLKTFSVDSFVSRSFLIQAPMIISNILKDYSLLITNKYDSGFEEKYISSKVKGADYCDTAMFYYSFPLHDKKIKISSEADSLKKGDLYKARFIYNPKNAAGSDGREILFEARYLDTPVPGEVEKIFFELNDKLNVTSGAGINK